MKNGQAKVSRSTHDNPVQRKAKADYRTEITPAPPPALPFLQKAIDDALASGAVGVRAQQRVALNAAKQYMDNLCDRWRQETDYLCSLDSNDSTGLQLSQDSAQHARAREMRPCNRGMRRSAATYARRWRPRFLAFLSVTNSPTIAARAARVDLKTAETHRKHDPEFAGQWQEACEHARDLLEARGFQLALEGHLEPVHYMGVCVDYVRKFDGRLLVEMLRGNRPDKFKTAGVNLNLAAKGDVFVLTEAQRAELVALNRAYLEAHPPPARTLAAPEQTASAGA